MNTRLLILSALTAVSLSITAHAETIAINSKNYSVQRKIERTISPGVKYLRLRLPDYPLNVNMIIADLNNPYCRIETTVANETAKGTEGLVHAAKRLDSPGHHPVAAANANFWVVSSQNEYPLYSGITRNVSLRNGQMVTECNYKTEKWDGGPERTGIVAVSTDNTLYIDYCTPEYYWRHESKGANKGIATCNKGYRASQYGIYNRYYGQDRKFMPYEVVDKKYTLKTDVTNAIENIFDLAPGETWRSNEEMTFICKEVRTNTNGQGSLGDHDLAIVSIGLSPNCEVGEKIKLKYSWTFDGGATPNVEQAIGGNAMVMRKGELTDHNTNEEYNSQVYSRTGYGCSEDGKTLYIVVIDKSTDATYGKSAGCSTSVMCQIARHFGCYNMSNFDAGGSAELMVENAIVNKTTETTPRNVANGWMIFNTTPESAVEDIVADENSPREIFTLTGLRVSDSESLRPGIYIIREGGKTRKELVR